MIKMLRLALQDYNRHFFFSVFLSVIVMVMMLYTTIFWPQSVGLTSSNQGLAHYLKQQETSDIKRVAFFSVGEAMQTLVPTTASTAQLGGTLDQFLRTQRAYTVIHIGGTGQEVSLEEARFILILGRSELAHTDFGAGEDKQSIRVYFPDNHTEAAADYLYPFGNGGRAAYVGNYHQPVRAIKIGAGNAYNPGVMETNDLPVLCMSFSDANRYFPSLSLAAALSNLVAVVDTEAEIGAVIHFTSEMSRESEGYYRLSLLDSQQIRTGMDLTQQGAFTMTFVGMVCFISIVVLVIASMTWMLRINRQRYAVHWLVGATRRQLFGRLAVYQGAILLPGFTAGTYMGQFAWGKSLPSSLLIALAILTPIIVINLVQMLWFIRHLDTAGMIRSND